MSEVERLRESAAMVQALAEQQPTLDVRNHLLKTARDWLRMAEKAEDAETRAQDAEAGSPDASISSRAA